MTWRPHGGAAARAAVSACLLPAGAVAVHQLRYWAAYGSSAPAELLRQGHSYLHSLAPWIAVLAAVAAGAFLRALGRALGGASPPARQALSFAALWLSSSACLLGIYVLQEFLEGLLATGHPAGLAGIFGFGGTWSIPAALAVGLVLAALLFGAGWVLFEVSGSRPPLWRPRTRSGKALRPAASLAPGPTQLALGWSGRGPPR